MKTGSSPISVQAFGGRPVYLDASALLKIYLPEPESQTLEAALRGRRDLLVSDLSVTEIVSALARRRREGSISSEIAARIYNALLTDVQEGLYRRLELLDTVHRQAEQFLLSLTSVPLRAADALHLALAFTAGAGTMVTFDLRLAKAAHEIGLQNAVSLSSIST